MVRPYQLPGAAAAGGAPVFGAAVGREAIQFPQLAQAIVNHGPDTGHIAFQAYGDLALAPLGAAAGTIEYTLGTS